MSHTRSTQEVEAMVPRFQLERLLNQDQAGRRISLLGSIDGTPALLIAERAAFSTDPVHLKSFSESLDRIKNLGANDIYSWFLASTTHKPANQEVESTQPPDLKLNLISPCTEQHIKKYSQQGVRLVAETPEIYRRHVRPYMQAKREQGRLNWVFNIIEGRTEQEDVFYREQGLEGFLMLPDLNWDRKTMSGLHLLGLVERRDIWSVRDLTKEHIEWLKHMRQKLLDATVKLYPDIDQDQLKLYIHYQPTYYHFHIHVVHVALEAGATQAAGKAIGLESIISQLESMATGQGIADISLSYTLGEASELWMDIFEPLKSGNEPKISQ
ncbi:mRNA decapping hydrolase [Eremomyces bilateralis CBS 781.70]|uniref:mRNA decapping hydrolase n=1 Tax=Eremomyces bilateralis CBS 781.70 TaxID=1392243 RepID=A0A6G1GHK2_9PEZI|nr:mRNA decapping hydrolase [Eremomyces bilateralis CBS 781.70]KAF1817533.1 mRNA decapping hydrolase [Eremomyces bilateralis CBS 781.70]